MNTARTQGRGEITVFSQDPAKDWRDFYYEVFQSTVPLVPIPEFLPQGFTWPILIPQHFSINRVLRLTEHYFPVWIDGADGYQTDLFINHHDRIPFETYSIWIRSGLNADQEHEGRSALDLKRRDTRGITLLERLMLELFTFCRTGIHLDQEVRTLCSGSCYIDGGIPRIGWTERGKLLVSWHPPDLGVPGTAIREIYSPYDS